MRTRRAYACTVCGRQIHPTAGTPLAGSSTLLAAWFAAAHLLKTLEPPPTALELAERLGLKYRTALRMRKRLLGAFADPDDARLLEAAGEWYGPEMLPFPRPGGHAEESERERSEREAILAAASRLIAERGLPAVKLSHVAEVAGLPEEVVRRRYRGGRALLHATLLWSEQQLQTLLQPFLVAEVDPVRRLSGILETVALPTSELCRIDYRLWLEAWAREREGINQLTDDEAFFGGHEMILRTVRSGRDQGVFVPVASCEVIVDGVIALADGLAYSVVEDFWNASIARSREVLHLYCEQMLGLAPGSLMLALEAVRPSLPELGLECSG